MQRLCARFRALWSAGSSALRIAGPTTSLVLSRTRTTAAVLQSAPLPEGTALFLRVSGRTAFPLWFSNVFGAICCIGAARVRGAGRRTRTRAAGRGPLPAGRGAPWNGSPPRAPGVPRGARIRPRDLHFPLVFKYV